MKTTLTTRRNLLIFSLLSATVLAIFLILKPCTIAQVSQDHERQEVSSALETRPEKKSVRRDSAASVAPVTAEAPKRAPAESPVEVDTAPPVNLSGSGEIPDVAKCVSTTFPAEAKPYVQAATVNVLLVVDKYGNVRSVKTTSVEFPQEPDEELLPMLRKAFIQAGNRAFGAKKCPPHVINGQHVGYSIEVPLQYRH